MALTKEVILETLRQVYDPEIPVDIVNLGLVYEVTVEERKVDVKMTTTATGCPMGNFIAAKVEQVIQDLLEAERIMGGVHEMPEVHVELVYDPPWSLEMASEEGKRALGWM